LNGAGSSPISSWGWASTPTACTAWALALRTWGVIGFELAKYATILCGAFTRAWGVDFTPTLAHFDTLTADRKAKATSWEERGSFPSIDL